MVTRRDDAFVELSVPEAYERFMGSQLFEPWARELVRRAAPRRGGSALDVATGPGTVARIMAHEIGDGGRCVASDISPAMLALASARPAAMGSAPIEYLECSATALACADESFELVVCQQGLQFIPDRLAALREIHRVLVRGGEVYVSTWAAEQPLGLFGPMADTMRESGMHEPYPRAFDGASYVIAAADLHALLTRAGFGDIEVATVGLDCIWRPATDAVCAVAGTPYGPLLASLPAEQHERVLRTLRERLGGRDETELAIRTTSNIARAKKDAAATA
ncbi:MAG: class I SAM-dependent methyltransferase [Solirubrobacteraceae bacterium]